MKKYLIILITMLIIVTGCNSKEESSNSNSNREDVTITKYGNEEGIVVQYEKYSTTAEREEYTITVTNAEGKKMILYSLVYFDGEEIHSRSSVKDLSDEEYQKIESLAFSKEFLGLDGDLTSTPTEGGSTSYITVYYNDTSFRTGGQIIKENAFIELESLLLSHEKDAE